MFCCIFELNDSAGSEKNLVFTFLSYYREGSCVATVTVSGLKKPTSGENDLSRELEEAVRTKKGLGEFKVSEYDGEETSAGNNF